MRLLVVDDNEDAANTLATVLRLWGHEVRVAYDGPTALTLARYFEPHVVLLDIQMPNLNGGDVAFRLRRQSSIDRITVIAVSATDPDESCLAQYDGLFEAFFAKPCNLQRLEQFLADPQAISGGRFVPSLDHVGAIAAQS